MLDSNGMDLKSGIEVINQSKKIFSPRWMIYFVDEDLSIIIINNFALVKVSPKSLSFIIVSDACYFKL